MSDVIKNNVMERIDEAIKAHPIIIFTKGTPAFSIDELSRRSLAILKEYDLPFGYVDLLDDLDLYRHLPRYKDYAKFPQFYIGGELIGDHDMLLEMHERGTLKPAIEAAIEAKEAQDKIDRQQEKMNKANQANPNQVKKR